MFQNIAFSRKCLAASIECKEDGKNQEKEVL